MNRYDDHGTDDRRPSLDDELRSALGAGPVFDHEGLVAGTRARAGRLRRRRAIAQGAIAAVLVPALAGTGWIATQRLSVDAGHVDVQVATRTAEPEPTGAAVTETAVVTAGPVPSDELTAPPHQDPSALPGMASLEDNPDLPNRIEIPDPRPTGIPELDALGEPSGWLYPRMVPLMDFVGARDLIGMDPDIGIEPHSGRDFTWTDPAAGADGIASVMVNVTAWDDAAFALDQLRTGGTELTAFGIGTMGPDEVTVGIPQAQPWPGHEGSTDHLLVLGDRVGPTAGALVRQGDYLVGVTVSAGDAGAAADLATQVADQTAANLAALDPAHGRD